MIQYYAAINKLYIWRSQWCDYLPYSITFKNYIQICECNMNLKYLFYIENKLFENIQK